MTLPETDSSEITVQDIERLVRGAAQHSDMTPDALLYVATALLIALRAPGDVLEIGTREGGSADLMLELMEQVGDQRFLVTVDPYGDKIYESADGAVLGLYGDRQYTAMREHLWPWPNHWHFLGTAEDWFQARPHLQRWENAVPRPLNRFCFVLHDGDHRAGSIIREVREALPTVSTGGLILVDNFDNEQNGDPVLEAFSPWHVARRDPGASQLIIRRGHGGH